MKKILFLINPVSGIGKQKTVERLIESELDSNLLSVDISYTQYRAHARELAAEAAGNYDAVVAVGGDGTVNEVASRLIDTDTALAIIPAGSGNGLARHLHVPLRMRKAFQSLNNFQIKKIDTLKINQYCCVNVAGIGFDAHISHEFEGKKMRGPIGYLQVIMTELSRYKSKYYHMIIDGKVYDRNAFLISFANSSQYGNNIYIAPDAKVDDGLIDVRIINDFPKIATPAMVFSMLDKSYNFEKDELVKAKTIEIKHSHDLRAHIDGEPIILGPNVEIVIKPLSLNVIVPPDDFMNSSFLDPIKDMIPNVMENLSLDNLWKIKKEN